MFMCFMFVLLFFFFFFLSHLAFFTFFFFFSSRRRHTRSTRDWSSDVCSSDLIFSAGANTETFTYANPDGDTLTETWHVTFIQDNTPQPKFFGTGVITAISEIGRASCRERV